MKKKKRSLRDNLSEKLVIFSIFFLGVLKKMGTVVGRIKINFILKLMVIATLIYIPFVLYSFKNYLTDMKVKSEQSKISKKVEKKYKMINPLDEGDDISRQIRKDWINYRKSLTKDQLIVEWYNTFKDIKYSMGGSADKFKVTDCSGAVYYYLRKKGFPGLTRSVTGTKEFAKKLNKAGLLKFKLSREASLGDLIIFKKNRNGIPHMGIVTEVINGYVCYVDMNGAVSMGLTERMRVHDYRIDKIVELSWSFWSTDYNKKLETSLEGN